MKELTERKIIGRYCCRCRLRGCLGRLACRSLSLGLRVVADLHGLSSFYHLHLHLASVILSFYGLALPFRNLLRPALLLLFKALILFGLGILQLLDGDLLPLLRLNHHFPFDVSVQALVLQLEARHTGPPPTPLLADACSVRHRCTCCRAVQGQSRCPLCRACLSPPSLSVG